MTTTIDAYGRLVVPKGVRDAAGFPVGVPLEVRFHDGRIEIAPPPLTVAIEQRGAVCVAVAGDGQPTLHADEVSVVVRQLRGERG